MWLCVSVTLSQVLGGLNSKEVTEGVQRPSLRMDQDQEVSVSQRCRIQISKEFSVPAWNWQDLGL